MSTRIAAALMLGLIALVGCWSDPEIDRAAWKAELDAFYGETISEAGFIKIEDHAKTETCRSDNLDRVVSWLAITEPQWVSAVRINVSYACPDRLDELEDALSVID